MKHFGLRSVIIDRALESGNDLDEAVLCHANGKASWVPDDTVTKCMHDECDVVFGFTVRKSHCRSCGKIYCKQHCNHFVVLDRDDKPEKPDDWYFKGKEMFSSWYYSMMVCLCLC